MLPWKSPRYTMGTDGCAGGIPIVILSSVIGFYLPLFLLTNAKLQPSYISAMLLISRVWDGFSDPTIGYFISKTKVAIFLIKQELLVLM